MKPDWIERIGYTIWAIGYAAAILLTIVLIMLVVTGCVSTGQVKGDTPWCFRAESRDGEPLSFCSAQRKTCREAQQLASHYASKHLSSVTRCGRE